MFLQDVIMLSPSEMQRAKNKLNVTQKEEPRYTKYQENDLIDDIPYRNQMNERQLFSSNQKLNEGGLAISFVQIPDDKIPEDIKKLATKPSNGVNGVEKADAEKKETKLNYYLFTAIKRVTKDNGKRENGEYQRYEGTANWTDSLWKKEWVNKFLNSLIVVRESPGAGYVVNYSPKDLEVVCLDWNLESNEGTPINEDNIKNFEDERKNFLLKYLTSKLGNSHNIILHGAPGTGKTTLARQIAEKLIYQDIEELNKRISELDKQIEGVETEEEKEELNKEKEQLEKEINLDEQIAFVQFHPSYDYTDFVEGFRPVPQASGQLGFKLQDGIFKKFVIEAKRHTDKKYVFIIDEINRGEISKIFGELFFSIDPGYRGVKGKVKTQYYAAQENPEELYIPENVYIIGTMNDIDRSVDTFDFAMRRRFRFININADSQMHMIDNCFGGDGKCENDSVVAEAKGKAEDAKLRLWTLNNAIEKIEGLNSDYHIGPAYFTKLDKLSYDELWRDYLEPLLRDYLQGMSDINGKLDGLKDAYNLVDPKKKNSKTAKEFQPVEDATQEVQSDSETGDEE